MTTLEQYKNQLNSLNSGSGLDVAKQTAINKYTDNVNAMQSTKAQAYSAKQNAIQNANTLLNASGMGNQGMAQTTYANIQNQYSNQLAQANANFNANQNTAYNDYLSQVENVRNNNVSNMTAELEEYLPTHLNSENVEKYQAQIDNLANSGEISQEQKRNLDLVLNGYREQLEISSLGSDATKPVNLGDYIGKYKSTGSQNKALIDLQNNTQDYVNAGLLSDGDYIDINWGSGTKILLYKNGQFYETNLGKKGAKNTGRLKYLNDDLYSKKGNGNSVNKNNDLNQEIYNQYTEYQNSLSEKEKNKQKNMETNVVKYARRYEQKGLLKNGDVVQFGQNDRYIFNNGALTKVNEYSNLYYDKNVKTINGYDLYKQYSNK